MLERTEKSGQTDRQTNRHIDQKQYTPARIAECKYTISMLHTQLSGDHTKFTTKCSKLFELRFVLNVGIYVIVITPLGVLWLVYSHEPEGE